MLAQVIPDVNQWTGPTPVALRILALVKPGPGCHEWAASRTKKGYGRFNYGDGQKETTAHHADMEGMSNEPTRPG